MIVGVTGHRPDKLGNYEPDDPIRLMTCLRLREELERLDPAGAITGMALGVDQDFAVACSTLSIPFIAAVPFRAQAKRWPKPRQEYYLRLLEQALDVVVVSADDVPFAEAMQMRNIYVVDKCDLLIAVWDGSDGGTANCIRYADQVGREILHLDPKEWRDGV